MITLKTIIFIIIAVIAWLLLVSLWGFYAAIHPPKIISHYTPKDYDIDYENVTFRTEDNILLDGWFVPSKKKSAPTIILLHGYGADKNDLVPTRIFLHENFNLLFFDFRYFGKSEGKYSTVGMQEVRDLNAAIKFLQSRGVKNIGVWGLSMGAAVAIMAAEKNSAIKALVAESSYARLDMMASRYFNFPLVRYPLAMLLRLWGYVFLGRDLKTVAPIVAASHLTIPVLLIYSQADLLISSEHGELLQKAFAKKSLCRSLGF